MAKAKVEIWENKYGKTMVNYHKARGKRIEFGIEAFDAPRQAKEFAKKFRD